VADLAVNSSTGTPLLVGPPVLIAGTDAQATSRTYRYYLKDKDSHNGVELFGAGEVTVEFIGGSFATVANAQNVQGLKQKFTLEASAPGAANSSKPFTIGPLQILGPSNRLAAFDVQLDVFGLLRGNFRVNVHGKFALRVAGLEVDVPDVVKVTAEGIVIQFDPGLTGAAGRSQELVRINSAKVLFPKFGVQGEIRPFDPSTGHNVTLGPNDASTGLIPGLVVRRNGFTIGTAELSIGR